MAHEVDGATRHGLHEPVEVLNRSLVGEVRVVARIARQPLCEPIHGDDAEMLGEARDVARPVVGRRGAPHPAAVHEDDHLTLAVVVVAGPNPVDVDELRLETLDRPGLRDRRDLPSGGFGSDTADQDDQGGDP